MAVLIQIVAPLALLAWLALLPARSAAALVAQVAGIGLFLLALALVAQWIVPPWWVPWTYLLAWSLVSVIAVLRRSRLPAWPRRGGWTGLAVGLVLAAVGIWVVTPALAGRQPVPVETVDIPNPLGPGTYLVGHGGSTMMINGHLKTLDRSVPRFADWRGQSYGVDLVAINDLGLRASGWRPTDPAEYKMFGRRVYAPCAGTVLQVEEDLLDLAVPEVDRENLLGNHVLLRCRDAVIVLAHLRQGSVAVSASQQVVRGAYLGEVGNSGNTTEPHLHLHAQTPPVEGAAPISGEPLGIRINGRFLARNDRVAGGDW